MVYHTWILSALSVAGSAYAFDNFGSRGTQRPLSAANVLNAAFEKATSQKSSSPPAPQFNFGSQTYDAGLFTPSVESLAQLGEAAFATLQHPAFPQHTVRIKKSKFCDTEASAYTGYIDVEARHLFFYFVRSIFFFFAKDNASKNVSI